jgi:hypothetical protein
LNKVQIADANLFLLKSHKISQTSYFSAGSVQLVAEPPLTLHAKLLLQSSLEGGEAAFRAEYGDYYVAALRLGGDSGAFVSVDQSETTTIEKTTLTVTVKVLFFKASKTVSHTDIEKVQHLAFRFAGYDTLDGVNAVVNAPEVGRDALMRTQEKCASYLTKGTELAQRAIEKLEKLGLKAEQPLSIGECENICQSGLVVQLLLVPYTNLRGYRIAVAAASQKN